MDYTKLDCPKLPKDEDALINSTRIRVGRNLADYPLGPAVTKEERLEIEEKITKGLSNLKGDLAGKYYSLAKLSAADKKQLIDDHFLFKEGDKYLESSGLERNWPEGRGIFHN
jgi:protein-arginine kinase